MYVYIMTIGKRQDAMNFHGVWKLFGDAKAEALDLADQITARTGREFERRVDNRLRFELSNGETMILIDREKVQ